MAVGWAGASSGRDAVLASAVLTVGTNAGAVLCSAAGTERARCTGAALGSVEEAMGAAGVAESTSRAGVEDGSSCWSEAEAGVTELGAGPRRGRGAVLLSMADTAGLS
ncbi:hypothetical protein JQX13_39135 [Archangium violaceum]|uniref:hypothetical protein n=1 Tax=Archangium violaceum TaxID=83451 RepID=UPI00193B0984|nr:hypothetical protein [Archangium violaceum]QRK06091.1 hypothetical protein JQX13_39135 [Archangium violaceum]